MSPDEIEAAAKAIKRRLVEGIAGSAEVVALTDMMLALAGEQRRLEGELRQVTGRRASAADPERDPLGLAVDHYRRAFGPAALPHLFGISGEAVPVAAAMLRYAVAVGRPLSGWQVMAALGIAEPPPGAIL